MKSTIIKIPEVTEEITYPCLREYVRGNTKIIVLFKKTRCGTVVYSTDEIDELNLGDFSATWSMNNFNPCNDKIVLEN